MSATPEQLDLFINQLADGQSISAAAKAAGIHRTRVYDHRDRDPADGTTW